jgi:hypothetical protein
VKTFLSVALTILVVFLVNGQDFKGVPLHPLESQIQETKFKLIYHQQPVQLTTVTKINVDPYIFNKHIHGTGEKFAMVGVYLNLYRDKVKLNINNISGYMFTSAPWALVSLNFRM